MQPTIGIRFDPRSVAGRILIAFQGTSALAIAERQWYPSQRIGSRRNGTIVLSLRVADTLELRRWIMSFGAEAEVLEPASLRNEIRGELQSLLDQLDRWDLAPEPPFLPMLEPIRSWYRDRACHRSPLVCVHGGLSRADSAWRAFARDTPTLSTGC